MAGGCRIVDAAVAAFVICNLQWTRVGAPVVEGFNGRYLYPLAPLLLLAIPATGKPVFGFRASAWLSLLAIASVTATLWVTWATYY